MANTTYTDNSTVITADTMNDLNRLHYTILSDPADAAAVRTALGLVIGTNVQAYGATLTTIEALSLVQGDLLYATGADIITRLAKGTAAQTLVMNAGATAPEWATPSAGGVTSVSGTAPVVSSGGTTPAISMAAATASVNGYMTSTYATKLDGIAAGATVGISVDIGNLAAGTIALVFNGTGGVIAAGSTQSGGSMTPAYFTGGVITTGAGSLPGTWRNIGGVSITNNEAGTYQRIS